MSKYTVTDKRINIDQLNALNTLLIASSSYDDIKKYINDEAYKIELLKKYNII